MGLPFCKYFSPWSNKLDGGLTLYKSKPTNYPHHGVKHSLLLDNCAAAGTRAMQEVVAERTVARKFIFIRSS
jgi:hypothetical protein